MNPSMAGYFAYSFRIKKTFPEKASLYGSLIKHVTVIGKNWGCLMKKKLKIVWYLLQKWMMSLQISIGALINKKTEYFRVWKAKYSCKKSKVTLN